MNLIKKRTRKVQAIILVMIVFMMASAVGYPVAAISDDYPNDFYSGVFSTVPFYNGAISGTIDYPGDIDCFSLTTPNNTKVKVVATARKDGVAQNLLVKHFELTRYDTYQRLNNTYLLTPTANSFGFFALDFTRNYYISVEHPDSSMSGVTYTLSVQPDY